MSPEKPTIIFRDDWEAIGSRKAFKKEKIKAKNHIIDSYRK